MKKVKNKFYILRISESTLGTSKWWISLLIQSKETGNIFILEHFDYSQLQVFLDYRINDVEDFRHSSGISESGNKFFQKEIQKKKAASQEEIEFFITHFTDKEKIKQKIKENLRETKLNILL